GLRRKVRREGTGGQQGPLATPTRPYDPGDALPVQLHDLLACFRRITRGSPRSDLPSADAGSFGIGSRQEVRQAYEIGSPGNPGNPAGNQKRSAGLLHFVARALKTLALISFSWRFAFMAATASTMLELGTSAPAFSLPDVVDGRTISLDTFTGKKALLV